MAAAVVIGVAWRPARWLVALGRALAWVLQALYCLACWYLTQVRAFDLLFILVLPVAFLATPGRVPLGD